MHEFVLICLRFDVELAVLVVGGWQLGKCCVEGGVDGAILRTNESNVLF